MFSSTQNVTLSSEQVTDGLCVYILPSANAKEVICELYGAISELQQSHFDGVFIVTVLLIVHEQKVT